MDALKEVLNFAREHTLCIDEEAAILYVRNRKALKQNPNDPELKRIARHFECVFYVSDTFDEPPECPGDCPECRAYEHRANQRSLERFGRITNCQPVKS